MSRTKIAPIAVSVALTNDNIRDWYPVKGTSADPVPELLPHLMHADSYAELTQLVRKRIKAEARKAGRQLSYSVFVSIEAFDPTASAIVGDVFLVATIQLK